MGLASAALKQAQVAFAACVAAQPAMLSDIISRLRSLLLSSARLSEGELLRRTDDLGPTTAQTAPHRVWRWDLGADGIALGTGPGRICGAKRLCAFWNPSGTCYSSIWGYRLTATCLESCSPAGRSVTSGVVCTLVTAPAWQGCTNKQGALKSGQIQISSTVSALQAFSDAASLHWQVLLSQVSLTLDTVSTLLCVL